MSALRDALRDLPDAVFADLLESEESYLVVVDLPGVSADTLDVSVGGGMVTIEARREKAVPPAFRYLSEERSLFLDTDLPLPPDAAESGVAASIDDGVLELTIPKRGAADVGTTVEVVDADIEEDGDEDA